MLSPTRAAARPAKGQDRRRCLPAQGEGEKITPLGKRPGSGRPDQAGPRVRQEWRRRPSDAVSSAQRSAGCPANRAGPSGGHRPCAHGVSPPPCDADAWVPAMRRGGVSAKSFAPVFRDGRQRRSGPRPRRHWQAMHRPVPVAVPDDRVWPPTTRRPA